MGEGGFDEVYLGQHLRLDLQAAIKVLHTHLTGKEAEHFQQEAQTIAKLVHPAIVRILDYDVQEGVPFLVMDYAPHGSLRQRHPRGEVVPLPQIVSYVKQVAEALQYAHEHKFIHRDVKPENMLLGRREEVLLSDFGIATLAHSTGSLSAQETGGTLAYMAPEQIQGHPRAASDQYALGIIVYEWLCGQRPFEGSLSELLTQHLWQPPPPLQERAPAISPAVEQVVLRALAKDPKQRFATVTAFAEALEQASQEAALPVAPGSPGLLTEAVPPASRSAVPTELALPADSSQSPTKLVTSPGQATDLTPPLGHALEPTAAATPVPTDLPPIPTPASTRQRRRVSRTTAALLIGLVVVIIAGGVLGSLSLLAHFGVLGTRNGATTPSVVRGGTWTDDFLSDAYSLLPQGLPGPAGIMVDQALYLPLFYGNAQGMMYPGAATEVPTVQNGGISADGTTWTFHLRPHLVWSDGQPYDARDVDYTWKLRTNPKFGGSLYGIDPTLISSAGVSADHLTIAFHLTRANAPFLSLWVDGVQAPLPMHHFSRVAPETILNSPDNLNPQVVSGPFMMEESKPGDHYTVVRNPRYYRAREGLPYLDKVVFRVVPQDALLKDAQAGTIDSAWLGDLSQQVQASHLEVRQAMAMAIDQQALINLALHGFALPLCTDHPSAVHPGYRPGAVCPLLFNPAAANKLLDDNGWLKGPDGIRARGGQRLEFEYSTSLGGHSWRLDVEAIVQRYLRAIGIQLDIQNYPSGMFFGSFLPGGQASPPTGAVAGRYDIAEAQNLFGYDPDDSSLLSCDQIPPNGGNFTFYCNHDLDALYKQELATVDPGVRQQIFDQIHDIYLAQLPFIVLFSPTSIGMVRKGTHNYQISPFEGATVNIWEWWCDHGKC